MLEVNYLRFEKKGGIEDDFGSVISEGLGNGGGSEFASGTPGNQH